jgi:hypothetical protein
MPVPPRLPHIKASEAWEASNNGKPRKHPQASQASHHSQASHASQVRNRPRHGGRRKGPPLETPPTPVDAGVVAFNHLLGTTRGGGRSPGFWQRLQMANSTAWGCRPLPITWDIQPRPLHSGQGREDADSSHLICCMRSWIAFQSSAIGCAICASHAAQLTAPGQTAEGPPLSRRPPPCIGDGGSGRRVAARQQLKPLPALQLLLQIGKRRPHPPTAPASRCNAR